MGKKFSDLTSNGAGPNAKLLALIKGQFGWERCAPGFQQKEQGCEKLWGLPVQPKFFIKRGPPNWVCRVSLVSDLHTEEEGFSQPFAALPRSVKAKMGGERTTQQAKNSGKVVFLRGKIDGAVKNSSLGTCLLCKVGRANKIPTTCRGGGGDLSEGGN